MSKKIMKRSLALGALMAFVITGSTMAAENINVGAGETKDVNSLSSGSIVTGQDGSSLNVKNSIYGSVTISGIENLKISDSDWAPIYLEGSSGGNLKIEADNIELVNEANNTSSLYIASNAVGWNVDMDFTGEMGVSGYNAIVNHGKDCVIDIDGGEGSKLTTNALYNSIWVYTAAEGSKTQINVDSVNFIGENFEHLVRVQAANSTVEITAKELVLENNFDGDSNVVTVEKEAVDAKVNIVATEKAIIKGNVNVGKKGAVVNLGITGADSTFTGKVITADGAKSNLTLNNGVTWNVTGESNVSKLDGTGAIIKVNELTEDLVTIDEKGTDTALTVTTSSDNFKGTADEGMAALAKVVKADGEGAANKLVATAGSVYDKVTADVEDGKVTNVDKTVAEANIAANDMAAVGLMSWRAEMNDMNKRMGELRNANGEHGVWVRMVRGESEFNSVKNQYNQYQLGYDEKLSVDKRWTVGAAISYTDAENNFAQGNGESTNKALSIYGSKLNADGTFVDLIAKYARLENEFDIVSGMGDAEYDANGYSFSAEFGKRIQQGNGLWIEPQVELTYGKVGSADYVTANKVQVAQDSMESLVGRVGFSLGKDIKDGNLYARASYLYDFEGETQATLNNDAVLKQDLGGGWWEVGVGANINLSKATYIYADVEKTFGGEVDTNWQWNLGVRYSF